MTNLAIPETEFEWDFLLQLIEEGKVIPVVGRDLLTVEVEGKQTQLYDHLAELLGQKLRRHPSGSRVLGVSG